MGKFIFKECDGIEGLYIIEPAVYGDLRGYFMETYNYNDFKAAGLDMVFVQDNQSLSTKGVLRGLHFQKEHTQGKLVRVISGEVFDVAVDIRKNSKTYGKWSGVILSAEKKICFMFQKDLHMVFMYCQILQSLHISVQTFTTHHQKQELNGTTSY